MTSLKKTKLLNCYLPRTPFLTFTGILNPEIRHLTRSLMTFEELESFITAQNTKLAKSNRFLCANIYNAYQYMVVLVKTSMNLNQDVISAHCSFKIAETIDDCEFPSSETIDFVYMGPIIAIGTVLIVTIIVLCVCWYCKPRTDGGFW